CCQGLPTCPPTLQLSGVAVGTVPTGHLAWHSFRAVVTLVWVTAGAGHLCARAVWIPGPFAGGQGIRRREKTKLIPDREAAGPNNEHATSSIQPRTSKGRAKPLRATLK